MYRLRLLKENIEASICVIASGKKFEPAGVQCFWRHPGLAFKLTLIPLLRFSSIVYKLLAASHVSFYKWGILKQTRLPLPVISVGNLTWGGTGKTPMVEFLVHRYLAGGITPLVLTRGYGGGDEARLLTRHLRHSAAAVGVGAKRAAVAADIIRQRGTSAPASSSTFLRTLRMGQSSTGAMEAPSNSQTPGRHCEQTLTPGSLPREEEHVKSLPANRGKSGSDLVAPEGGFHRRASPTSKAQVLQASFGVAILDDGMQHWALARDLELVMVSAQSLWGNGQIIPRGPLREPPQGLERADVVIIHHSDLVSPSRLQEAHSQVTPHCRPGIPLIHSRTAVSHLAPVGSPSACDLSGALAPMETQHSLFQALSHRCAKPQGLKEVFLPFDPPSGELGRKAAGGNPDEKGGAHACGAVGPEVLRGAAVVCLSAIGLSEAFHLTVMKLGAIHVAPLAFRDHHFFQQKDLMQAKEKLADVQRLFPHSDAFILVTEKDFARDEGILQREFRGLRAFVLCSHLELIDGFHELDSLLAEALAKPSWRGVGRR